MRDSAVLVIGLLLLGGCGRVYVNPARSPVEQKRDLAACSPPGPSQVARLGPFPEASAGPCTRLRADTAVTVRTSPRC